MTMTRSIEIIIRDNTDKVITKTLLEPKMVKQLAQVKTFNEFKYNADAIRRLEKAILEFITNIVKATTIENIGSIIVDGYIEPLYMDNFGENCIYNVKIVSRR